MTRLVDWMEELDGATRAAEAAEAAHRVEALRRTKELEQARAFAFRRLNLLRAVSGTVAAAEDEAAAVAHGLAMLRARLGWSTASEARDEIVDRFAPVCLALRAAAAPEEPAAEEVPPPDPAAALTAFESWFLAARGTPFWVLFEHYMPETPRVDW